MNIIPVINNLSNKNICPNCGKEGPHFVGPSFGEIGFFICDKEEEEVKYKGSKEL
jgi:hypothetical protein